MIPLLATLLCADVSETDAKRVTVRIQITNGDDRAFGSGVLVHTERGRTLAITNYHVAVQNAGRITVDDATRNWDGTTWRVVASDFHEDLAVLEGDRGPCKYVAKLAPFGHAVSGALVHAGCPRGRAANVQFGTYRALGYVDTPIFDMAGFRPLEGRSGGSVFCQHSFLVGLVSARGPDAAVCCDLTRSEFLKKRLPPIIAAASASARPEPQRTVVVYSMAGCVPCDQLKGWMRSQGIGFIEKDVMKDPTALAELRRLGSGQVPLTVVGGARVLGFNPEGIRRLLR